jgi:hypothetical protein
MLRHPSGAAQCDEHPARRPPLDAVWKVLSRWADKTRVAFDGKARAVNWLLPFAGWKVLACRALGGTQCRSFTRAVSRVGDHATIRK